MGAHLASLYLALLQPWSWLWCSVQGFGFSCAFQHRRNFIRVAIEGRNLKRLTRHDQFTAFSRENDEGVPLERDLVEKQGSSSDDSASLQSITFHQLVSSEAAHVDGDREGNWLSPTVLADFLLELGAASSSVIDHDRDTGLEDPLYKVDDDGRYTSGRFVDETYVDMKEEGSRRRVWNRCDVGAHFPMSFDMERIVETVRETFELPPSLPMYTVERIDDMDWMLHVQKSWQPMICEGFVFTLPWHTDDDVADAVRDSPREGELVLDDVSTQKRIRLQGGIAFGGGEHPTTRLCLKFVRRVMIEERVDYFLDYGSGSGILGLAACALSNCTAVGVEIDRDAICIANANADENALPMSSYLPPLDRSRLDDESLSVVMTGSGGSRESMRDVEDIPKHLDRPIYDACSANILAGPLIGLAPIICGMLCPGAQIGLSGVLESQADDVMKAYSPFLDRCFVEDELEGWVLITGQRSTKEQPRTTRDA